MKKIRKISCTIKSTRWMLAGKLPCNLPKTVGTNNFSAFLSINWKIGHVAIFQKLFFSSQKPYVTKGDCLVEFSE